MTAESTLTPHQQKEARKRIEAGETQHSVARSYGHDFEVGSMNAVTALRLFLFGFTLLAPAIARPVSAPDLEEIVKAHAPQAELDLLNAYSEHGKNIAAPNDIIRDQLRKKQNAAWRSAVLKIGNINRWSASVEKVESTDSGGRITLGFARYLSVFADVPEGTKLFAIIRTLSDNNQLVYVSGHITNSLVDSTNEIAPTCFDEWGAPACEVAITSIEPIQ
jgi:hypothetical protein